MLTRRLDERERVESWDDRRTDVSCSSRLGVGAGTALLMETLLSDLP